MSVRIPFGKDIMHACSVIPIVAIFPGVGVFAADILPKGWISPEQLESAERPIQLQFDTGIAMGPTAWDMAAVKDARLLLIYLRLYERLPDELSRVKLLSEQEEWLQRRRKAVEKSANPDGGSAVTLDQAGKHIDLTEERIGELQKRLHLLDNADARAPKNGVSPATPPRGKAGAAPGRKLNSGQDKGASTTAEDGRPVAR